MAEYQVIARKFRPQTFKDVMGQEAIVTTLKNALKFKRLAQAYLFCGSRGTGKTTLARLLAKAVNCQQLTADLEPCNLCVSCREIMSGASLDVLEIDGASHRGIEDIRQINETVGYAASSGYYKIYIIDEVHMLTKEAFNALLKTLEEPPPKVKFFFATTEPHKVLPTILSRCQRFNLSRISLAHIVAKLRYITSQMGTEIEEEALRIVAQRAEGGLRDAESLLDQILAFAEGPITAAAVTKALGLMPREIYFEIDRAGKEGHFAKAFEIAHDIFNEGKDLTFFIEGLMDHLRHILLMKVSGPHSSLFYLTDLEKERYAQAAHFYTQEQCLDLIEYLLEAQHQLKTTAFSKISLETILLHVMRSHFRLPIEQLVRQLGELEALIGEKGDVAVPLPTKSEPAQPMVRPKIEATTPSPLPSIDMSSPAKAPLSQAVKLPPSPSLASLKAPTPTLFDACVSEDPTPTPADLGKSAKVPPLPPAAANLSSAKPASTNAASDLQRPMHEYDTLLHFAAVEFEGRLQKHAF